MPSIEQELEIIKIKLADLEQEKKILQGKYQKLLESKSTALENANAQHEVLSTDQKVNLFAHLFKGRDDIYALRWQNINKLFLIIFPDIKQLDSIRY